MARNGTRIQRVMKEVQGRITARQALPGARLPSVRAQARALGVSVSTVVEAYERLAAEGLLVSRPGSGFYVSGPIAPLALAEIGPRMDREVDPLWISRQSLDASPDTLRPGCGWLPDSWMYEQGVRRALRGLARATTPALTEYSTPLGHPPLRQVLARRMAATGIDVPPEQILLTDSGTQSIDLICRFLLEPGDTVLVDDPCYFNFHALLKAHRVKVVGVPYTPGGPDLAAFQAALDAHAPRLYITNSGIHNPTGAVLAPPTAHRLLKLAEPAGLTIVEDDIFADFETTPAPRLAAFDGLTRVIHISSFSKTVSASARCGYIAARADWIEGLLDLKTATTFSSSRMAADLIHRILTDSGYRRHMEATRLRLAQQLARTAARLRRLGIQPWLTPAAGMFLWCRLPEGRRAADVARACLKAGVVMAPGDAFSPAAEAGRFLRFNVAQCTDERIFTVLAEALRV
ncbi:GntR family transcriptional regulator [Bordetella trematum]|uniref:GntR family transcriptional regulator n=1 Tax=Bordetella trematum TaxID=123899 RepID=A0A157S9W7_9BORD|nr:PLP-dependent aminotransferase family protein [Bordetella trematum]AUL48439.1 GntR family transcriptional regulator [Bordetella trematum]AZR95398.1 GntR family transcriptional regulator [Bordetella trematum]NNH17829.1 PLP-dependent aminotransferase family protein [Bordetella trematum]QIM70358.1 PLP-dependent aminotransferase family protein [Bordetella trematum]SAI34893.1 GntR family transcriptional regulator [Bordetella trematum]